MNNRLLAHFLTFAGSLPLFLSIILKLAGATFYGITPLWIFLSYSVVIISFISGIHWGIFLTNDCQRNLFIESNIIVLTAWTALLINHKWCLILTLCCFIYLLLIDKVLFNSSNISKWYWKLRKIITALVVLAHIFCIALLF